MRLRSTSAGDRRQAGIALDHLPLTTAPNFSPSKSSKLSAFAETIFLKLIVVFLLGGAVGALTVLMVTGIWSLPFSGPPQYAALAHSHQGPVATLVVMHFKRTPQVQRIVSVACRSPSITEVLVWDANTALRLSDLSTYCTSDTSLRVVDTTGDFGLHSRYAMALLAANDLVIIQDDDLEMSPDGYDAAVEMGAADPDVIHGPYGRWPTKSKPYDATKILNADSAPIILTKFLVAHRTHFSEFFKWAPAAEKLPSFTKGVPRWNGEDLLLSLAVLRRNEGRLHHLAPELLDHLTTLPAPDSISGRMFSHHVFRSEFVVEVSAMLGLEWPKSHKVYPNPVAVYTPAQKDEDAT